MKKFFLIIFFLICSISCFQFSFLSFAENTEYKVCVNQTSIFSAPDVTSEIVETLFFNDIITISDEVVNDVNSNIKYFKVIKNDEIFGYVISTTVSKNDRILYKLQTNSKINKDSDVYILNDSNYEPLKINDLEIVLKSETEVRLLEKYNPQKEYLQIAFSYKDEILTGYVKTENISVSGFNYYFLIAIFLIVIIGSTVIPIVYKNWKKHKKINNNWIKIKY